MRPAAAGCRAVRPARGVRVRADGQEWRHVAPSQRALHHARPVARRLPVRARPSGGRDARHWTSSPAEACCSPTTGPTRRPAGPLEPASTPAPTSTATAPSSTAPRSTPASRTWPSWPGPPAMTPSCSGTRTPRSIHARSRRATRGCSVTKGSCRASGRWSRTRGSRAARPGAAGSPRRASTCPRIRTSCTSRSRASRAPTTTGRPGLRRVSHRALPDELPAPGGGRVAGATRRRAVLRPRLVHPPPSAPAEPARLSRPLRGRGGRAVRRVPDARGGVGPPPAQRVGHGTPVGARTARRAGASAAPCHLLRRPARGGRRVGPPLRLPDGQRAGRVDAGGPDERPRRDGRRPLAAREARLLGRELPRTPHRGGPESRRRTAGAARWSGR